MWILETVAVAFSMYSRLPVPRVTWRPRNMAYAMVAFPLVGGVVGLGLWLWALVANGLALGPLLRSVGFTAIPLLITGGIHMDGFCDTVDALSSQGSREKKLEILEDPHIGAFAVMGLALHLLVSLGLFAELAADPATLLFLGAGFVLSRTLSGLAVVVFPSAKESGLARTFADASRKRRAAVLLLLLLAGLFLFLLSRDAVRALVLYSGNLLLFAHYYFTATRKFGGVTGDLAGWFLQHSELLTLALLVVLQKLEVFL